MEMFIAILMLLLALATFSLSYVKAEESHRKQWHKLVKRAFGIAVVLMSLPVCAAVTSFSVWQICIFVTASGDIRRGEVVMLILHFINLIFYAGFTFGAIGAIWQLWKSRNELSIAATPPAESADAS